MEEFLDTLPDKIIQLLNSFRSRNYSALSDVAHNLKGVSASLGAMQLSVSASNLDQQSRNGESSLLIENALDECDKLIFEFLENAMKEISIYTNCKGKIE